MEKSRCVRTNISRRVKLLNVPGTPATKDRKTSKFRKRSETLNDVKSPASAPATHSVEVAVPHILGTRFSNQGSASPGVITWFARIFLPRLSYACAKVSPEILSLKKMGEELKLTLFSRSRAYRPIKPNSSSMLPRISRWMVKSTM